MEIDLNIALAYLEIAALRHCSFGARLAGVRFDGYGTPIYDLNGKELLRRYPLLKEEEKIGYADITNQDLLGNPLQKVVLDEIWDEDEARRLATKIFLDQPVRFIIYDYPRLGVTGDQDDSRVIFSLPGLERVPAVELDQFGDAMVRSRWSLLDSIPAAQQKKGRKLQERLIRSFKFNFPEPWVSDEENDIFSRIDEYAASSEVKVEEGILRYSSKGHSHGPCLEVRGQKHEFWCAAACIEMCLDFYRYEFPQEFLAGALGLGTTVGSASALQCSRQEFQIIEVLESLTCKTLSAWLNRCAESFWGTIRAEVDANRPSILFANGHARVVAGYISVRIDDVTPPKRGLLLYDPYPPNKGEIVQWEAFDTAKYSALFGASLKSCMPTRCIEKIQSNKGEPLGRRC